MNEMVVEKLASTIVTEGMTDEWLECVNILDEIIDHEYSEQDYSGDDPRYVSDILEELETIKQFLDEFKLESETEALPRAYAVDKEPKACGSCHMLGAWYDDGEFIGWKCVLDNGPSFKFNGNSLVQNDIWFKICEYHIRRVD